MLAPLFVLKSNVPARVTPLRVPPEVVPRRTALPLVLTVPPLMVPLCRFQVPVLSVRANVRPWLFNVPVRLTVLRNGENAPRSAWVNVPARLTVELVALMTPRFSKVPSSASVPLLPPPRPTPAEDPPAPPPMLMEPVLTHGEPL